MPVAFVMSWIERGWGIRPDGYSLHATREDWTAYYEKYRKSLPKEVPEEYSAPDSNLLAVEVDQALAEKLAVERSIRYWEGALILEEGETGGRSVREKVPTPAQTFIERCIDKKVKPENIDDFIDMWHTGKAGTGLELREFLGMSKEDYAAWMKDPQHIYKVLFERMQSDE